MATALRALLKLLLCVGHLLRGMWTIARHFSKASPEQRNQHIAHWAKGLLAELGVRLQVQGEPQQRGPLLVVCNHISWLDILVLLAAQPVRFVSKSEVRRWPVIGWLATQVGTLYIERASRRDAHRVVSSVAEHLQAGALIAVFPEGTTSDGAEVLPFHGNLLQSAISAQAPVQPVALQFMELDGTRSMSPCYVGDDSLLQSVWRLLSARPITAKLIFAPPVLTSGGERRALALQLQQQISQLIQRSGASE
jgi:1-acyl-sn-glycerol-3-phosphate acyltransferase